MSETSGISAKMSFEPGTEVKVIAGPYKGTVAIIQDHENNNTRTLRATLRDAEGQNFYCPVTYCIAVSNGIPESNHEYNGNGTIDNGAFGCSKYYQLLHCIWEERDKMKDKSKMFVKAVNKRYKQQGGNKTDCRFLQSTLSSHAVAMKNCSGFDPYNDAVDTDSDSDDDVYHDRYEGDPEDFYY